MAIDLKNAPEIKRIVLAADPSYKKHKAIVTFADHITISGTYWGGGSRSTYTAVNINTLATGSAPQFNPPQFGGPKTDPKVEIPEGIAIVETGFFCGKVMIACVTLREGTKGLIPANTLLAGIIAE